jgi:hypothetical protein
MYILNSWYVLYVLLDGLFGMVPTRPADSGLRRTTHTNCRICTLLPPDDASPKHVEV